VRTARFAVAAALVFGATEVCADATDTPAAVLDALERAFKAREVATYLVLWDFETPDARDLEQDFFEEAVASPANRLILQRPLSVPANAERVRVPAQVVLISEPRANVEEWTLVLRKGPRGWTLAERQAAGRVEGLVHLSLDPAGYRADGLTLRLEDFELSMNRGTFYTGPPSLGPTVLVFVGDGTVKVSPGPETERQQLRQYCGYPELVAKVEAAFVRLHPADFATVLTPVRLDPDPDSRQRWADAERFYRAHSASSFVLDGMLPGSPWWVLPSLGDSLVTFDAGRRGTLTFTINTSLPEGISLFDRARRLQICLYPSGGREARYNEDEGRAVDVLSHDLRVHFDPRQGTLRGQDTLRMRVLTSATMVRLRLDDALAVESITSPEGGRHLFFRVRNQGNLLVTLGGLGGTPAEIALTIQYAGAFSPAPVESEVIQAPGGTISTAPPGLTGDDIRIEKVQVFSNRNAWYPQASAEDYATATVHIETPLGFTAVFGGERTSAKVERGRTVIEYRLDRPAKYLTVAVGRLMAAGSLQVADVSLTGFAVSRAREEAAQELERARDILRFFSQEFGPCPYPALSLVLIEGQMPGGHSPAGMVILARQPALLRRQFRDDPTNFSDVPGFFLAHELAHQWWGQGVGPQNYRERWLSEGAAQYAAALWTRRFHGEATFRQVLKRMASWAARQADKGPIHLGHRLGHLKGDPEIFRAIVYDKGAYVLHMLRGIVGDEAFRQALLAFQSEHRFAKAGTDDLRMAFESVSGRDLSAYFRLWIFGTALPRLRYSHQTTPTGSEQRTAIDVSAENLPGPVPLELAVIYERGRAAVRVTLPPEGGRFSVETPTRPRKVEVNADRGLLEGS